MAREAAERIAVIFHTDNLSKGKSSQEILDNRQQSVKPLVDAFFAWVKDILNNKVISSTDLKKALTYSVNQEKYLRVFLESAIIPLDNNDAERSIKKFCVGKHSWHIIDSKKGAKASAFLYSIAETAKANGLNPFEVF
ncbi:MAG: IS66 family transposase [Lachnospiraceae bacterium]